MTDSLPQGIELTALAEPFRIDPYIRYTCARRPYSEKPHEFY